MSQPAADAAPRSAAPKAGGGMPPFLAKKYGPIPVWGYGLILAALLVWRWYSAAHAASSSSEANSTPTPDSAASVDTTGAYAGSFDSSQVPQFVNQTYTSVMPPAAPAPTVNVTTPPATPAPTPAPKAPQVSQFPKPTGLKASAATKNGVTLTWQTVPVQGVYPASYTVAVYNAKGKAVSTTTVNTPDATKGRGTTTLTGLPAGTALHANVWPNGGKVAPQHTTVNFTTAK